MEILILFWIFIGGIVGGMIGAAKNRTEVGIAMGMLLGFIGWIIVAVMPANTPQCSQCLGRIPFGAKKCLHCGSDVPQPGNKSASSIQPETAPGIGTRVEFIERYSEKCPACGTMGEADLKSKSTKCAACGTGWVFNTHNIIGIARIHCPKCESNTEMPREMAPVFRNFDCPSCKTTLRVWT